jgi:hypothetical protein
LSSSAKAPPVYIHYRDLSLADQASVRLVVPLETHRTYYCALRWQGGHLGLRLGGECLDRQAVFCVWDATEGPALSEVHACGIGADHTVGRPGAVVHHAPFSWEPGAVYEFVLRTDPCAERTFLSASVAEILPSGEAGPSLSLGSISLPGRHALGELGSHLQDVTPTSDWPSGRIPLRRMRVGHVTAWCDDRGYVCRKAAWSSVGGAASDGPVSADARSDWFWLESGTGIRPAHRPDEVLKTERPQPLKTGRSNGLPAMDAPPAAL